MIRKALIILLLALLGLMIAGCGDDDDGARGSGGATDGSVGTRDAGDATVSEGDAGPGGTVDVTATDEELERFQSFFDRWGGAAIIGSRILPILPEVVTILAGIAGMHPVRFIVSLLLGTIPTALLFSWIGYASRSTPSYGMGLAVLIPLLLWPLFLKLMPSCK